MNDFFWWGVCWVQFFVCCTDCPGRCSYLIALCAAAGSRQLPLLVSAVWCTNASLRSHAASFEALCSQGGTTANRWLVFASFRSTGLLIPPLLTAGPLNSTAENIWDVECDKIRGLMSRYLYNRFGEHGPSWDMFRELHEPSETAGDTADHVVDHVHEAA